MKTHFEQISLKDLKIGEERVPEESQIGAARNSRAVQVALVRASRRHVTSSN